MQSHQLARIVLALHTWVLAVLLQRLLLLLLQPVPALCLRLLFTFPAGSGLCMRISFLYQDPLFFDPVICPDLTRLMQLIALLL